MRFGIAMIALAGCGAAEDDSWAPECRVLDDTWTECRSIPSPLRIHPDVQHAMEGVDPFDTSVRELYGQSDGAFVPELTAAAADLVGDALPDLVVSGVPGLTILYENLGRGRFRPVDVDLPPVCIGLGTPDLDADGRPEIVCIGPLIDGDQVEQLTDPKATLLPAMGFRVMSRGATDVWRDVSAELGLGETEGGEHEVASPRMLTAAFMNGDQLLDLVVTEDEVPTALLALSGEGRWSLGGAWPTRGVGTSYLSVDLDQDGEAEVIGTTINQLPPGEAAMNLWDRGADGWERIDPGIFFDADVPWSPMGAYPIDLGGYGSVLTASDGRLDLFVSDLRRQRAAVVGTGADGLELLLVDQAFAISASRTVWDGASVTWAVAGIHTSPEDLLLVAVGGFEHATAAIPQHLFLHRREGDLYVDATEEVIAGRGPREGGAAQERGLVVADFDGDGCPDLFPLPVLGTEARILFHAGCDVGRMVEVRMRSGAQAYGATLTARYEGGTRFAAYVGSSFGYNGWSPPTTHIPTEGLLGVDVAWADGTRSTHDPAQVASGVLVQP